MKRRTAALGLAIWIAAAGLGGPVGEGFPWAGAEGLTNSSVAEGQAVPGSAAPAEEERRAPEADEGTPADGQAVTGADDQTAPRANEESPEKNARPAGMFLKLVPENETAFTNVLLHYVYFTAEVKNVRKLTIRVYNPEGEQAVFRTTRHVENGMNPGYSASFMVREGQEKYEGLNVLFKSGTAPGIWTIEVTGTSLRGAKVTETLQVAIRAADPLEMKDLEKMHGMIIGEKGGEPISVQKGKIRYIAQDPKDSRFVEDYWYDGHFDLRRTANVKCTRAIYSMALSYLGIDCTPIAMSQIVNSYEIGVNYDQVTEKLGNVERVEGTLEELWRNYQEKGASPVFLHFRYEEGMHALLLIGRDEENPQLFYAVTTGQRVNTSAFPDGKYNDFILPILIEEGVTGARIQSPLLKRYHKGVIDQIWQWRLMEGGRMAP